MAKEIALEIMGTRAGTHKSKKTASVSDLDTSNVEKTANDGPESKTTNATQLS